jgi:hypothetical protein
MDTLTYQQQYYRKNRIQRLAESKQYSQENRDAKLKYLKEYYRKNKEKYKRTPEQQAEVNRRRREKYAQDKEYREKQKSKAREYQEKNPRIRKAQRIKKFGITLQQFEDMYEKAKGRCEICGFEDDGNVRFFPFVDHCHQTGRVRGLLCTKCNFALGHFDDNIEKLEAAIKYLQSANTRELT